MDDDEQDAWDRLTAEELASIRSLSAGRVAEADSMLLCMALSLVVGATSLMPLCGRWQL